MKIGQELTIYGPFFWRKMLIRRKKNHENHYFCSFNPIITFIAIIVTLYYYPNIILITAQAINISKVLKSLSNMTIRLERTNLFFKHDAFYPKSNSENLKMNVETWIFLERCFTTPLVQNHKPLQKLRFAKCVGGRNPIWPPAAMVELLIFIILALYNCVIHHFVRYKEYISFSI